MNLLKIELRKLYRNRIMWITIAAYALTMILIFVGIRFAIIQANTNTAEASNIKLLPEEIFRFPDIWHYLTFFARYIKVFLAVIMVAVVTNEFTYDTLKQSVINGLTRWQLILSKFYVALMLAFFATLILFLFGVVSGFLTTENLSWWKFSSEIHYLWKYFLMMVSFLSLVSMLSFLVKRAVITLGTILIYSFVLEPILSGLAFQDTIGPFMPMTTMNNLIPLPPSVFTQMFNINNEPAMSVMGYASLTFVYILVFQGLSYLTIRQRDL